MGRDNSLPLWICSGPMSLVTTHFVSRGCRLVMGAAFLASTASAEPTYRAIPSGPGTVARLQAERGESGFLDILRVNRRDSRHAMSADTLLIPEPGLASLDLSPFPRSIAVIDSIPKLIVVSIRVQAFAAYERGTLVRWGAVCTGGPNTPTRPGTYRANWKARTHRSSVNENWIMPFTVNIDARVGTALHEYDLPGQPTSHCCIRLLHADAEWVFGWVESAASGRRGTLVVLIGDYDFESRPPWMGLASDPEATRVTDEEIVSGLAAEN